MRLSSPFSPMITYVMSAWFSYVYSVYLKKKAENLCMHLICIDRVKGAFSVPLFLGLLE